MLKKHIPTTQDSKFTHRIGNIYFYEFLEFIYSSLHHGSYSDKRHSVQEA